MKKKIYIAVGIVCLVFLAGGIYLIAGIEGATSKLNYLIKLHQVELWRKQLVIIIEKVQSDLTLSKTPFASKTDSVIENVRMMDKISTSCLGCHHTPEVEKRLKNMLHEIDDYKDSLSRFLTIRANSARMDSEYNTAFHIAEKLLKEINNMVIITSAKLSEKTQASHGNITRTKVILYALVVITPFFAALLGFIFIKELTKPVKTLLEATRRLKGGDLDHRIKGLTGEFGEVADSFNDMSRSLKEHMHNIEESEKRYRVLFESAGDAIFIFEAEEEKAGQITAANLAAAKMHGCMVDELEALRIQDIVAFEKEREITVFIQRILKGEWINEVMTHVKKDGTRFPVEMSAGLIELGDRKLVLSFNRDITDRRKMESLILQSKVEWEETFNNITDMITIHDEDFNIIRANKSAEKILGLPFLELTQAKCYTYYHGKDRPPEGCPSCECLTTGEPASFEMFEPHLNKFLEIRAMPRFDEENRLIGLIHVIRDISERKKVEAALQRAEQMRMVGEWAAGLAHEIKNSLAGIKGTVQVIGGEQNISEEDKTIVVQAIDEIKRIEFLLKSLLNFAKPPKPNPTEINVNEILDKTVAVALKRPSVSSNGPKAIKTSKYFDQNVPLTLADPMLLQQAFLNLLFNAIEAMPDGGILGLKTHFDLKQNTIQIMISDTGKGINKEMMESIFQPFFTTKRKGTGLGLAITRRLIEQSGGDISVESEPDKGSVFNVVLHVREIEKDERNEI
jgi:PAS domain S-box-containing protein